jgi:hypothetical protein
MQKGDTVQLLPLVLAPYALPLAPCATGIYLYTDSQLCAKQKHDTTALVATYSCELLSWMDRQYIIPAT